jgi:hypothetical protein
VCPAPSRGRRRRPVTWLGDVTVTEHLDDFDDFVDAELVAS